MAINSDKLLKIVAGVFNAAPGADFLPELTAFPGTESAFAREMVATSAFTTVLNGATTPAEIAAVLAGNFGLTADDVDGSPATVAIDFFTNGITGGANAGDLVLEAVNFLETTEDTAFASIKQLLDNKAAVSAAYSAAKGSTTVADLQAAFSGITGDAALTEAEITALVEAAPGTPVPGTPNPGETFELTTGAADVVESADGDDTITGTTATLQSGDVIIDSSTTDNDTFNLTLTAANATTPIVQKIENVNVILDYFTGTTADLVMTNYKDSTVTLGSEKLGFNGVTGATNVGGNMVKAGANVDTITVTGVTTGGLDVGSAGTANFTGLAGVANSITVNGDVNTGTGLTNTTSTVTTLNVTAAADVIYATGASAIETTVSGDNDVNLTMSGLDIIAGASLVKDTTGTVTVIQSAAAAATLDSTNFDIDKLVVGNIATVAATVASGQLLETNTDMTSLTVATTLATATTATLNLGHDVATLVASDALLDTTINNTDANAIGVLTATGQDVTVTGSGNLTVGTGDALTFDASALTGELVYTLVGTGTTQTISGGTGVNTVTLGNVADIVSFTGQGAVDTLDVSALALTGTAAGDLGAGNDIVKIGTLGVNATIALQGGAGTDILKVTNAADLSAMTAGGTWAVLGFEEFQLQKTADSLVDILTVTAFGSQLTGSTFNVTTQEAIDTVGMTVTADGATTDLSGMTFLAGDTVAINGTAATAQTIIGSNVADTITANTGTASVGNTLTGGAGDDVFTFVASDSTEASMTSITDYQAAAAASDNDTLTIVNTALVADQTVDVSAVGTIFAGAGGTVNAVVSNGVMSLSGLSADVALANTLAEMIDIAEHVATVPTATTADNIAFAFGGNTYVVSTTALDATDLVVELTGTTGITAMDTVAAANTILIA